jgi:hypothetical protein
LESRWQFILAEFAIAILIKLPETLEHGPAAGRAAGPAANHIAAPAANHIAATTPTRARRRIRTIGERAFELVARNLAITILIESFERSGCAFDFAG